MESDKNKQAAKQIDRLVEMWNKAWMADALHDQAVAGMQGRCRETLRQLHDAVEHLMLLSVDRARSRKLGVAAAPRCAPPTRSARRAPGP